MENLSLQLKRLAKLHKDSASYYSTCAEITTEEDLQALFNLLAEQRMSMATSIDSLFQGKLEKELWMLRDELSYLQKGWYNMKLAIIVNNRPNILRHCLKNEYEILQQYEQIAYGNEIADEVFRQGVNHHQLLKINIERILGTPDIKFSRQKNIGEHQLRKAA